MLNITFDIADARKHNDSNLRAIASREQRFINYDYSDRDKNLLYSTHCVTITNQALVAFALGLGYTVIFKYIENASACCMPLLKFNKVRRFEMNDGFYGPYDRAAVQDYFFSQTMALIVSALDRDRVTEWCEKSNYGRYKGEAQVNSHEGVYCRMLRAFFLNDSEWLKEEVNSLLLCKPDSTSQPSFAASSKMWYQLFCNLFYENELNFMKAAKKHSKWYEGRVIKSHSTAEGVKSYASINVVLLSALRIARLKYGAHVSLESPFLPLSLIPDR